MSKLKGLLPKEKVKTYSADGDKLRSAIMVMMASHFIFLLVGIFVYPGGKILSIAWEVILGLVAYHAYMSMDTTSCYGYVAVLFTDVGFGVLNMFDFLDGFGWIIYPVHMGAYVFGGLYIMKKFK